jgi:hypothetical protein
MITQLACDDGGGFAVADGIDSHETAELIADLLNLAARLHHGLLDNSLMTIIHRG